MHAWSLWLPRCYTDRIPRTGLGVAVSGVCSAAGYGRSSAVSAPERSTAPGGRPVTLGREPQEAADHCRERESLMRLSSPADTPASRTRGGPTLLEVPAAGIQIEPVIATKLFVPALGSRSVERPRLRRRLEGILHARLTVVV